ncbi:NAD(P)-binding protein [Arhodomonas sp. SL1]|uniref:NAD(P)-binding protein n=1 Tax=Arhodomonas sp. SL1 TaxID=3425691 RepID=UPI003F8822B6
MATIETDYLVIGAGALGMAFVDALIEAADANVVLADRRHRPGGHWHDAYPFVRLHQPSACYGVNSMHLGADRLIDSGPDEGCYERATAAEICEYYGRVLDERLLPSGRVRFHAMTDYVGERDGEHVLLSRLTGRETTVHVRRRLVDATWLEASVPETHVPPFSVDPDARLISPTGLTRLSEPGSSYTILGAGKTAMDTCSWLLDQGVEAARIRWIRSRDSWLIDRGVLQPLARVPAFMEWMSGNVEAAARAGSAPELFERLDNGSLLHRLDPEVPPAMYRGAILSAGERDALRRIDNVVRLGRVTHLEAGRVVLERGTVATNPREVYVDCTAEGIRKRAGRPIFQPGRITLQAIRFGMLPFSAALTGYVEAARDDDTERNRLCSPNPLADSARDWIPTMRLTLLADMIWSREPDLQEWLQRARLNIGRGAREHRNNPRMQAASARMATHQKQAIANLKQLTG